MTISQISSEANAMNTPTRKNWFVIVFDSRDTGKTEVSRSFTTIRVARKWADSFRKWADNVRIMQGGPGGIEVS